MSYQVLARKYRPHNFQEMAGQQHVLRALVNALDQNRLHHAYLFTGTRGVGKTTLARILAKCFNCEQGVSSQPCNQCSACQQIDQGRFVDLLEIDAASRTKVEDTRELLENVQYAPACGRYKVYLIDEVHMLSGHSFNALLKTLEEPPPHVKFLLATTDPQRLPVTVLSRCLQFNLKNLSVAQINAQLENVLKQENIIFDPNSLPYIARAAHGSVRDALSLLDQAIAYGAGELKEDDVKTMLGSIEQTYILQLLTALSARDAKRILATITQLAEHITDFGAALEELLAQLHRIAIIQAVGDTNNIHTTDDEQLVKLAQQLPPEDVQLFYQIGLIGRRDLPLAPSMQSGFEMILLRMLSFRPVDGTQENKHPPSGAARHLPPQGGKETASPPSGATRHLPPQVGKGNIETNNWPELVPQLGLTGFAHALAMNCTLQSREENTFNLLLDANQAALRNPKSEARIIDALNNYFGQTITLRINMATNAIATPSSLQTEQKNEKLKAATQTLENDANLQAILKAFDATIQPASIQAKNPE